MTPNDGQTTTEILRPRESPDDERNVSPLGMYARHGREVVAFTTAPPEQRNQAFLAIVESHQEYLIRFCLAQPHIDLDTARSLVAEAFIIAYKHLCDLKKPHTVRKWLGTIVKRSWEREQKRLSTQVPLDEVSAPGRRLPRALLQDDHTNDSINADTVARVSQLVKLVVAQFDENKRELHTQYSVKGLRGPELARALGETNMNTVYTRVHRYQKLLNSSLHAELVVRELTEDDCPTLRSLVPTPRPEVLPFEVREDVIAHLDSGCARCAVLHERAGRRWVTAVAVIAALWASWLVESATPSVQPVSYETDLPPVGGGPRLARRRRRAVSGSLWAVLGLILLLTIRSGSVDDLSLGGPSVDTSVPTVPGQGPGTGPGQRAPGPQQPPPAGGQNGGAQNGGDQNAASDGPGSSALPGDVAAALVPATPPPPGVLALTPAAVTLPLYATTAAVGVSSGSDMSWTVSTTDPAITVSPTHGVVSAGHTTLIQVTVNRNATATPNSAIVVTSPTGQRVTTAVHWPTPGRIGITTPRVDLGAQAATASFSVTASKGDLTWSTSSPNPAVGVSPASGALTAGKGALVIVRLTRPISTGGEVPLRFTTPDGQQTTVVVHWLPSPGTLHTSTNAVHIQASDTTASFTVSVVGGSNTWTAAVSAPGCYAPTCGLSVSPASGAGNATVTVRLYPHPSLADPTAHAQGMVTLSTPDGQRVVVGVTWDPYEPG